VHVAALSIGIGKWLRGEDLGGAGEEMPSEILGSQKEIPEQHGMTAVTFPGGAATEEITMRYAIALSAVLAAFALSAPANAQTAAQSGKYCLIGSGGGGSAANCSFQTMAACEKSKSGENQTCTPNKQTTGSGMMKEKKN
jgi:hypothetical protein